MGFLKRLFMGSLALLFATTAVATIFATTGSSPTGIVIDAAGNLYVANALSDNVSKITPDGTSTILGATGPCTHNIAIDPEGYIYTTNYCSDNVSKFAKAVAPPTPVPALPFFGLLLLGGLMGLFGLRQLRA